MTAHDLPDGYEMLQRNPGLAVCLVDGQSDYGHVYKHLGSGWCSVQMLDGQLLQQAVDQVKSGVILDGGHNMHSLSGVRFG